MVTLSEVKAYLWISGSDDDIRLQAILDWVNAKVEAKVWDLSFWEKSTQIYNWTPIVLSVVNPTKITEINWVDFSSKVVWTDYLIKYDWEAKVLDLCNYIENDFWIYEVKFEAWFTETPKSLIAIVSKYVWYLYSQDMWKNIVQEQLWPRWVSYENFENYNEKSFGNDLLQFIPLALKIF